jgi:CDP-diacylglycerol--glycerol-3-phosphate 3-phosphatidyltransferase
VGGVFTHWPNRITAMRFVGALFLFFVFSLISDRQLEDSVELLGSEISMYTIVQGCFWMFVVLGLTDVLDGYLARRDGHVSVFGRIADPFVDKVLILGTLIFMCVMPWARDRIPAWFVVIILAREFLVTGIRGYVESIGEEFAADWFGKIKMILQSIAVAGVMVVPAFPWPDGLREFLSGLETVLIYATLVATIGSGVSYVVRVSRILSKVGR